MRAKLIVEGKEFDIDIFDPELQKLVAPKKKTGYERVKYDETYFCPCLNGGDIIEREESGGLTFVDDSFYENANYYSSKEVARNNARADKLMRQLRRFAVEHREKEIDWNDRLGLSFIGFGVEDNNLMVLNVGWAKYTGQVVFDSAKTARQAIDTFHDELIWYFTEYKDSL